MAATIYAAPEEIKLPEYDWKKVNAWREEEERYTNELLEYVKENNDGEYIGEIISFPVADGKALYMVASMRPLELIHMPLGDAWNFPQAHLLTQAEVKKMVERDKRLAELFKRK